MNSLLGADFSAVELEAIRSDFPILARLGRGGKPIAYLDASATSQKPASVIDAEANFYRRSNAAVHRGTHILGDEATSAFEDGRSALASFIGGRSDEIVWTKNATEAIYRSCVCWPWRHGFDSTENWARRHDRHHSLRTPCEPRSVAGIVRTNRR